MIYLNPTKEKVLTFEVELSGASSSEIKGYVRFFLDEKNNVQVGFPVSIEDNKIQAVIAPLKKITKTPIKNGMVFEAQLDVYTEDNEYFSPWKGEIEVKMPVTIEAKLANEDVKQSKSSGGRRKVHVKAVSEDIDHLVKRKVSEMTSRKKPTSKPKITKESLKNITKEQIYEYMYRAGTKNEKIQEIVWDQARVAAGKNDNFEILKQVVKILKKDRG
jgi:hypothetical protein